MTDVARMGISTKVEHVTHLRQSEKVSQGGDIFAETGSTGKGTGGDVLERGRERTLPEVVIKEGTTGKA